MCGYKSDSKLKIIAATLLLLLLLLLFLLLLLLVGRLVLGWAGSNEKPLLDRDGVTVAVVMMMRTMMTTVSMFVCVCVCGCVGWVRRRWWGAVGGFVCFFQSSFMLLFVLFFLVFGKVSLDMVKYIFNRIYMRG